MKIQDKPEKSVVSRRRFILGVATVGAGLSFKIFQAEAFGEFIPPVLPPQSVSPNSYVTIDPDGTTTILITSTEMGQGVRTSLAMIVAEEMDADWSKVRVKQSPDSRAGGSTSVSNGFSTLRSMGAQVRAVMISAAAKTWGIAESECSTLNGFVLETNGTRKLSYGDLTDAAVGITPPNNPPLKAVSDFNLIGTPKGHIDAPSIVNGSAIYGMDIRDVPGLKYAVIAFPPTISATLKNFDKTDTMKVKGVVDVVRLSNAIAVLADTTWAAMKGRDALKIDWDLGKYATLSSADIAVQVKNSAKPPDYPPGTVKQLEAIYETPFYAHASMEPMNWAIDIDERNFTPSQMYGGTKVSLIGGSFGRRLDNDFIHIADDIGRAVQYPVMLVYTRADDMKNDHYYSVSYSIYRGGFDANGKYLGVSTRNGSQNIIQGGYWRSVWFLNKCFTDESFNDEVAAELEIDPLVYRQGLSSGRLKDVLDAVSQKAEWTKPLPKGWGRGIACFAPSFGSYIANVIEVSVSGAGILKVERVVAVVDCGIVINPLGVEAQIQGAIVDGLSIALKAEITIENGAVKQSSFSDYQWLRINEMPKIEVYILPSTESPGGIGELGVPAVAPALCNAIFNATGQRIRKLPIQKTFLDSVATDETTISGDVKIFPSPFKESFTIEAKIPHAKANFAEIRILNILGSEITSVRENLDAEGNFSSEIRVPPSPAGVYFAQIQCGGHILTRKIVKE